MFTSRTARLKVLSCLALLSLPVVAGLSGCAGEGGAYYSDDHYLYTSRAWEPKTITLIDTRTGESLWSVDIPVGKELSMGFSKGTGPNEYKPDELVWEMRENGKRFGSRNNRMPCPPRDARRVDMTIRPKPEMPGTPVPGSPFRSNNEGGAAVPQGYTPPVQGPYIENRSNVTPPPPTEPTPAPEMTEPAMTPPPPEPIPAEPTEETLPDDMLPPR